METAVYVKAYINWNNCTNNYVFREYDVMS